MSWQPVYEVLKISLVLKTCLEVMTFSWITHSLEVIFLSRLTIFLVKVVCFTRYTYVKITGTSNSYTKGAYTRVASNKDVCIGSTSTENA